MYFYFSPFRFFLGILLVFVIACNNKAGNSNNDPSKGAAQGDEIPEIKALTEQIALYPENPELYYNRAEMYVTIGKFNLAIADLEKAANLSPSTDYYHVRLSDVYLLEIDKDIPLPDSRKAIQILEDYHKSFPENDLVNFELAATYTYVKMYGEAISQLEKVISRNKFSPETYFQLGLNHKYLGDTTKAISYYLKSVEQNPDHYDAYMQLGTLFATRKNKLAVNYFDNAIRINPESTEAHYAKARFYQTEGQYQKSLATYRQLILLDTQYEQALYNMGYIYYELDSLQKAYDYFDKAIQVSPDYTDAYFGRGFMAEEMGQKDKALRDYKQALNLDPGNEIYLKALDELK